MAKKTPSIEKERSAFRELVAANPNYFGNQPGARTRAVKAIAGNTKYEELRCVGFNPKTNRLEATVQIKLPFGYGGGLCQDGSTEYVRFFVDYGGGWEDAGLAAFEAHDLPDGADCTGADNKPLCYVVTQTIEPKRKYCKKPVLPKVRAILSWQMVPPPGDPTWPPVWGNVLDRNVQIKPRPWLVVDIVDHLAATVDQQLAVPPELIEVAEKPLPLPDPGPLALAELVELYGETRRGKVKTSVEPHRFGLAEIEAAVAPGGVEQELLSLKVSEWQNLGIDFSAAVNELAATQGNVSYEQLTCVGLDTNLEQLIATFQIKRPGGYSGPLCGPGSYEHIAFWADWDDECEWTYLGTVSVNVHDIPSIPAGGLHYAAYLPVDLTYHRRGCKLPKIGRVRAVLSWSSTPSTTDPDKVPYWGNRLDCHVQIPPGPALEPGEITPLFHRIGGIRDDDISNLTGLTLPTATFDNGFAADGAGRPCPFAGRVVITGPPFPGHFYRLQVRKLPGGLWTSLVDTITIEPLIGPSFSKSPIVAGEYYSYEPLFNNPDLTLGWWETSGDDLWEVKLDILGQPGSVIQRVRLKNSGIEDARIHISSAGDCGKFTVGDEIDGAFVARDPYLRHYTLGTLPFAPPLGQLSPTGGTVQTPPAPPEPAPPPGGLAWTLDTENMASCGYVVVLNVRDRAIINSHYNGHHGQGSVGFCLLDPS